MPNTCSIHMQYSEDVELQDHRSGWREEAACSGLDTRIFFPASEEDDQVATEFAKQVCSGCPVQQLCLEYSIQARMMAGIWGGATSRERRRLRRRWLEAARRVC